MRRGAPLLLAPLLLSGSLRAAELETSLSLSPALRADNFHWSIGAILGLPYRSPAGYVNILSELTWRDVKVQQLRAAGQVRRVGAFCLQGQWEEGWITEGRNQDSDYTFNDRNAEFSRSENGADTGRTRDVRLAWGAPLPAGRAVVTPFVGWQMSRQRLMINDGRQTVDFNWLTMTQGATGAFPGLNNRYEHRWNGLWWGLEAEVPLGGARLGAVYRLRRRMDYKAEADWNLRTDYAHPKSFEHEAQGRGWDAGVSLLVPFDEDLDLGAGVEWRRWRTGSGTDRVFFSDGSSAESTFNGAVWDSFSFQLTVRFRPFSPEKEPPEPF